MYSLKIRTILAVFFVIVFFTFSTVSATASKLDVKSESAILMDYKTGDVLYEKHMHKRLPPASTTKIMTAIIAIESGRLDDIVKVSAKAASTSGSTMHLYAGQNISLHELVTGLLMRSGNDAAVAIAEHLCGSIDSFVEVMNHKAHLLGAFNTHFRNPHGLSAPGHFSSAFDLAIMTRYALENPTFSKIVGTKETNIEWLDRKGQEHERNLKNTNKLLWMLEDADGVKTGTTNQAGPCLVSSATRDNQKLICVVLHDHSRWYDSMKLLKYGFDNYDLYFYCDKGEILSAIPVDGGIEDFVNSLVYSPAALVVNTADYSLVTVKVDLPETLKAPVYQGQKIGEVVFYLNDKPIKTVDIVAAQQIEEYSVSRIFLTQFIKGLHFLSNWGIL